MVDFPQDPEIGGQEQPEPPDEVKQAIDRFTAASASYTAITKRANTLFDEIMSARAALGGYATGLNAQEVQFGPASSEWTPLLNEMQRVSRNVRQACRRLEVAVAEAIEKAEVVDSARSAVWPVLHPWIMKERFPHLGN